MHMSGCILNDYFKGQNQCMFFFIWGPIVYFIEGKFTKTKYISIGLPYPRHYNAHLELTEHVVEITIECTFFGQNSIFWAIFLNRMCKFAQNLN